MKKLIFKKLTFVPLILPFFAFSASCNNKSETKKNGANFQWIRQISSNRIYS